MNDWIKSLHIITMVCWFAGLFYLPRLFVYHSTTKDQLGNDRFKIMESKLFYIIMNPAAIMTMASGIALLLMFQGFIFQQKWIWIKLALVAMLITYHCYCGYIIQLFAKDRNPYSEKFYRYFNEIPSVLLILIVVMAVIQP